MIRLCVLFQATMPYIKGPKYLQVNHKSSLQASRKHRHLPRPQGQCHILLLTMLPSQKRRGPSSMYGLMRRLRSLHARVYTSLVVVKVHKRAARVEPLPSCINLIWGSELE